MFFGIMVRARRKMNESQNFQVPATVYSSTMMIYIILWCAEEFYNESVQPLVNIIGRALKIA
jgi:hypothetical protein